MLTKDRASFEYNIFDLFKYKLSFFLNSRSKKKRWKGISYVKWEAGVFDLNLVVGNSKVNLINWYDHFPNYNSIRVDIVNRYFTDNDFECIKILLSRIGYLFRVNDACSDKDYRLFFFITQLANIKNISSNVSKNELMTSLCQQLLCELFMSHEDFSRFKIIDNSFLFHTEKYGYVAVNDIINIFFLSNESECGNKLGDFYLSVIDFLFARDKVKYHYDFNDINEEFIYPDFFVNKEKNEKIKVKLSKLIGDILNPLQSTHEVFVSNILLMNIIFYILKDNPGYLMNIYLDLDDDSLFFYFLEAVIKRRLIIGKEHFSGLNFESYLQRIKLNETQFYNILTER